MASITETIIVGIFGVVCALIGIFYGSKKTYNYSLKIIRQQEFIKACIKFRNSFVKEVHLLEYIEFYYETTENCSTMDILNTAFNKHLKAMMFFRPYLKKSDRVRFDRCWYKYSEKEYIKDKPAEYRFSEYFNKDDTIEREKEVAKVALKKIKALLEFTNYE